MIFLITILAVFFAMNMGGASFAASFAAAYGGKVITRRWAGILYVLFVILGAVLFGKNVSHTLGHAIMPAELISDRAVVIIFLTAGLSMFAANLMKIPQTTSIVTVAAIAGVGAGIGNINTATILFLIPFWVVLPIISFVLTYFLAKLVYPPRSNNFWIYEKFINQRKKLILFVIACSCYNAFSIGANNVANVVGPLFSSTDKSILPALFIFAIFYGAGAFTFTGPIKTVGNKIVPLGFLSASLIALVSGTLMIVASALGIPQSFVMLKMGAVFAISSLKQGQDVMLANPVTRNTFYTWTINPALTFIASYFLTLVFMG